MTKIKVSPVSGDDQLLASNSSTITNTTISPTPPHHPQYNSFNNLNCSSNTKLACNNLGTGKPSNEDYLHLCDTLSNSLPHYQNMHSLSDSSGHMATTAMTNLNSSSDNNLLVNKNKTNNGSSNSNINCNSTSEVTAAAREADFTNQAEDDEVEVVLRRNNKVLSTILSP